jgi:hypothetical protein
MLCPAIERLAPPDSVDRGKRRPLGRDELNCPKQICLYFRLLLQGSGTCDEKLIRLSGRRQRPAAIYDVFLALDLPRCDQAEASGSKGQRMGAKLEQEWAALLKNALTTDDMLRCCGERLDSVVSDQSSLAGPEYLSDEARDQMAEKKRGTMP